MTGKGIFASWWRFHRKLLVHPPRRHSSMSLCFVRLFWGAFTTPKRCAGETAQAHYCTALLTASKKWTFELPMQRTASWRHVFEANVDRFAMILQVHGAKPINNFAQQASIR